MAADTGDRLLSAAIILFSENWYETVSVAEICRKAGLSNGIFYRYFKDKEQLFSEINRGFLEKFSADLSVVGRYGNCEADLKDFISITVGLARRYGREVSIFREGQYHYLDLERQLRQLYMDTLARVFGRSLSEAEYLYAVSGIRFLATRSIYDALEVDEVHLARLILNGVFDDGTIPDNPDPGPLTARLDYGDDPVSRVKLAEAGMRLFGERGFYAVGVSEICLNAGLSVGTFYQHFETKEEFLDYLVKVIGHSLRYFLKTEVSCDRDRLCREVDGMGCFARFFMDRPEFYSIVRQAEFVAETWVRDYYDRIEDGYRRNLGIENDRQAVTTANFLMGLSHYMGIELIFSDRVSDPAALLRTLGGYLKEGLRKKD